MLNKHTPVGTPVKVRYTNFWRLGVVEDVYVPQYSVTSTERVKVRFTDNQELREYDRWEIRLEEITNPVEIARIKQYENRQRLERDRTVLSS